MIPLPAPVADGSRLTFAATCLTASAATGGVAIVALGAMFGAFGAGARPAGEVFGFVNDVLALPTLLLAVPAIIELRRLLRPAAPLACDAITALALLSTAGVVVLQGMLVLRMIPFEQQVGPVMVAYLGLMAWYVASGIIGSRAGLLPRGGRMGLLGASYVGYPAWAVWLARQLRSLASAGVPGGAAVATAR